MIAASEPLEFIPRGRQAVDEHPGPSDSKVKFQLPPEHVLLQRMQNVNISSKEEHNEYWSIREIYKQCDDPKTANLQSSYEDWEYLVNSEEELYVRKHTAVWTKGLADERSVLPRLCFTCDTPIKFAFFCSKNFACAKKVQSKAKKAVVEEEDEEINSVCLIDGSCLRVYCSNGEDYLSNLEFPISNIWQTRLGILLEKIATSTVVQNHTIAMPRLFSLGHPLDEICPVLNKSATNAIGYLTESEYTIIFSAENSDFLLMYDSKIGKHFIAKLRKATEDEVNLIGIQSEAAGGMAHHSIHRGGGQHSISPNSMKFTGAAPKNSTAHLGRSSLGNTNYTTHIGKFLSGAHSSTGVGNISRTSAASPLFNLQSSMGEHSVHDMRKIGQAQPSKPIVPELCVEHIWTETMHGNRECCEISTRAFIHTDLICQTYFCYLLPRSCNLQLVRFSNCGSDDIKLSPMAETIMAKDAVALERLKMIAVLDPSGSLILYTGTVLVTKVHVALPMKPPISVGSGFGTKSKNVHTKSPNTSFPRRSSLLPTLLKPTDTTFEEELHLLSPVHPLQPQAQFTNRNSDSVCLSLRDPAGNRLTLVYASGKMLRISLPMISEKFVSRCIGTLRQILTKDKYLHLITRWYSARNPPGSRDYSVEQEWEVFKNVLSEAIGCAGSTNDSSANTSMSSFNAEEPKKRRKNDENITGTNEDWEFMLSVLEGKTNLVTQSSNVTCSYVNTNAPLFTSIPGIFYGFHLLYEDFKLDHSMHSYLPYLAKFLHQLAIDMQLASYIFQYALDFPQLVFRTTKLCQLTEQHGALMLYKELLQVPVATIYKQLEHILCGREVLPYTYVDGVNDLSRNILQVISLIMHGQEKLKSWIKPLEFADTVSAGYPPRPKRFISTKVPRSEQVIQMLISMDITRKDIEHMPVAIHLIIAECLEHSRVSPPIGCSPATYELILRSELAEHAKIQSGSIRSPQKHDVNAEDSLSARCPPSTSGISKMESALDDGMDNIDTKLLSLRFPDDMRIAEVRRLLTSSEAVLIDITQSPGTSDHEFIEEQEKQLYAICIRTMTLPMGRGMLTLRTSMPTPTESMPIPKLCLSGKEPIKGATIEMQQIEFPANMNLWPTFHNGVAAGLKISPNARDVDSNWIVYNKPKGQTDTSIEHAGFLMGLGLNGHLKSLAFISIYKYLMKCDEMTSVGLLLGISSTYRGTMDNTTTKLLSVHLEAFLPATALELDIQQNVQVASLMGVGLLYQGTAKRHIAEVLVQEVGRPPGPEMGNSIERESYALTAGLALGLVTLGQGEAPAGLRDLQLPDTLHYYMVGGNKRLLTGSQREKYKLPSFQVREGDNVNIDVTAPGATLALGLMFFNTNNQAVAEWMNPPHTRHLLDLVRPDLLLLRIIARGLIMWSEVQPDEDWLYNQFPSTLKFDFDRGATVADGDDVDHEAITQAYCNIIAGAAFCIGLRYASSENPTAGKALRSAIKQFLGFSGKYVGEFAGRTTIESCLLVILISISLVYAGSGDLEILRIIRYLRSRIGPQHSQVTYGSHMAIHMALGLLFLGAGRFTLAKTPEAIAALVCAFFPKFPNHSNDNRYHLQAFRHLYVLAVEPRLFLPRDIDSKKLSLCNISVLEVGSTELRRLPMAPCILPELNTLQKVVVDDTNYWPVSFEKDRNWDQLLNALENSACIDIKKRSGCLSHLEDPDRLKSLFAQTLTSEQYLCWEIDPKILERFSNEPYVIAFTDRFLHVDTEKPSSEELVKQRHLTMMFYNAVIKDKMHVLPIYLSIFDLVGRILRKPKFCDIWQVKLIDIYNARYEGEHILFSKELVQANVEKFKLYIEKTRDELSGHLKQFLSTATFESIIVADLPEADLARFIAVINYYNLIPNVLNMVTLSSTANYLGHIFELRKLNLDSLTIYCIIKIIRHHK